MSDLVKSWNGIIAVVGIIAFAIFALPTPQWLGWPALIIAIAALGRMIVVGDRRYHELRGRLNIDDDTDESSRKEQIMDLLDYEKKQQRR